MKADGLAPLLYTRFLVDSRRSLLAMHAAVPRVEE